MSLSSKKFNKSPIGKVVKTAMPLMALMGGGAFASSRVGSVSRQGKGLNKAAVYVDKSQSASAYSALNASDNSAKAHTQQQNQKRSAFGAFTNQRKGDKRNAEISTDTKALAFLKANGLLRSSQIIEGETSGDLSPNIGRKEFVSCTHNPGTYTTESSCTQAGHNWNPPAPPNNIPTVLGQPSSITVAEDAATNIDLSGVTFADDDNDSLTVSLVADKGTFAATSAGGVSIGGSSTYSLSLTGSAGNINTFLDTVSNIQYTGAANLTGNNATYFYIRAFDGTDNLAYNPQVNVNITTVNDAPSFNKGADVTVSAGAGAQTINNWATSLSKGGGSDENSQTLSFNVSNDNNALFSVQPTIDASGNLTYTPNASTSGSATVTVSIADDGGTANGGVDTSADQTFTITTNAVIPTITSATYDHVSNQLVVTGTNFAENPGAYNDIDVSKLTITGQGGAGFAYTLTTASVERDSATQFTVTLNGTDAATVEARLNKDGLTAEDSTTYNLAAADDFVAALTAGNSADFAGNGITVSNSDTTPPAFDSAPSIHVVTETSIAINIDVDESATVYAVAVPDGAAAPSANQIIAGQDASGSAAPSGSRSLNSSPFGGSMNIHSVTPGATYDIYLVARDGAGNTGVVSAKIDATAQEVIPTYSLSVTPDPLSVGSTGTLTLTIDNSSSSVVKTNLAASVSLPNGLEVHSTPGAATTCTGGTLTAVAGSSLISYSGGSISANSICTVMVDLTRSAGDEYILNSSLSYDGDTTGTTGIQSTTVNEIAPRVTSVLVPANSTYTETANLDFTVNFDEAVDVDTTSGTPRLTLTVGATTRYATYQSGTGTTALTFRYTVQAGDEDLDGIATTSTFDVNGGTIQSAADINANNTLNSVSTLTSVFVDALAPVVAEVTPVATPTNNSTPDVTFSLTQAGTLAVGGSCGTSSSTNLSAGNSTITLTQPDNSTALTSGTYSDCTVIVTDAAGNASNTLSLTAFSLDATDPALNTNSGLTVDEASTGNVIANTALAASDNISAAANVTYTLVNAPANGTLRNGGTALVGGGTFTQANLDASAITYDHNGSETTADTFTFTVRDGAGNVNNNGAANFTYSITVTPQPDAPTIAGLTDRGATEDVTSSLDFSGVTIADIDTAGDITVTITAGAGAILGAVDGAGVGAGVTETASGNNVVTLVGTAADITTYLGNPAAITYTSSQDRETDDTITFTADDSVTTPSTASASIIITPINDLPTGTDKSTTLLPTATHTFAASDFGFSDVDSSDTLAVVRIDSLSIDNGTLQLNGTDVVNGDIIADCDISSLVYTPTATGTDTFTFSVNDGTGFSVTPNTMTINVNAPTPPPVVTPPAPEPAPENNAPTISIVSAPEKVKAGESFSVTLSVADSDSSDTSFTVTNSLDAQSVSTGAGNVTLSFVASEASAGESLSISFSVSDGEDSGSAAVSIAVESNNTKPTQSGTSSFTLTEDNTLTEAIEIGRAHV